MCFTPPPMALMIIVGMGQQTSLTFIICKRQRKRNLTINFERTKTLQLIFFKFCLVKQYKRYGMRGFHLRIFDAFLDLFNFFKNTTHHVKKIDLCYMYKKV